MNIQKSELRKKCKKIRDGLETDLLSEIIIDNLFSLSQFKKTLNVFSYVSFGKEVSTERILALTDKNIFVPKIKNDNLIMCEYFGDNLVKNKFGILEPEFEHIAVPQKNDIIIIPALTADENFHRLGYGGGYYDKYLQNTIGVKIVLLYETLLVSSIPVEKHDVEFDILVTEKNVYIK